MARKPTYFDRDKLRGGIRRFGNEYFYSMLEDAIELMPEAILQRISKKHLVLKRLCLDRGAADPSKSSSVHLP